MERLLTNDTVEVKVKNKAVFPGINSAINFIFFQLSKAPKPHPNINAFVWEVLSIPSGGGEDAIKIPFSAQYTATATIPSEGGNFGKTTPPVEAADGDVLVVSQNPQTQDPQLVKMPSGVHREL